MKIIAVYAIKGGVGKTATAVNLAYYCARQGLRTLIWDLDAQGASTYYFRIKPKLKGGSKNLLALKHDLDDLIKGTDFDGLDLLPADFSIRHFDLLLDDKKKPTQRLRKLLQPMQEHYDVVFLDCPPGLSLLSEAVLNAAHYVLSPIIPTILSLRTLEQLKTFIQDQQLNQLRLLPFFSMVDRRKKSHIAAMQNFAELHEDLLTATIPYASDIERMSIERMPLAGFVRKSRSTEDYLKLWEEVLRTIQS